MTELLLGIDVGTSSTKAVLTRPDGAVVASAVHAHAVSLPRPGWVEHDVEQAWWGGLVAVCAELLPSRAAAVRGVAVSGIGPCVVPCDGADRPLRPAILYGVDTRAELEVAELTDRLGEEAVLARCGSALSSQALGPKLLWLARHEPDVWRRTRRWHMASSFAVARLTGEWVLDHPSASQCDPLYDLSAEGWYAPWADEAAPGLPLPSLAWPSGVVGQVTERAAAETGIPAGTPVAAGTIDAWAEALSVGVRRTGDLMLMYGSTMFLIGVVDERTREASMWNTLGIDSGSLTVAAGMATSGSLTAWLRDLFGSPPFEELVAEAASVPAGSEGVLCLPYFQGERTPILDPRARGTIAGLTIGHGRGHLYRAALEGIAFGVRHNLEAMGIQPQHAVAVGGGTTGGLWPRIVSNVCGLVQELPQETIGASLGDALLAAEAVGLATPGASWARAAGNIEPEAGSAEVYDELYGLYRGLYPATLEIQHALARLQLASASGGRMLIA